MRKYLSMISLLMIILFIVFGFIIPQVLHPLPDSWDILILISMLIVSFFTAIFSVKGRLKTITVLLSSLGILSLIAITIRGFIIMTG
ncbi:histidine kinase [Solibacillus sp. FSL K6-1126]|uniref:histidine kinase n=1 Tax=Solibacillus sp. FSL K6-1126 TaxID=2921463 RepID=UPI0030F70513